jgi:DNA-binding PadR family transcriptional regulator
MPQRTNEPVSTVRLTLTESAILGLLVHLGEPTSGYDLRKIVDRSIGFIWQPSKTQLYAVLGRLVRTGMARERRVRQRGRPDKTLFAPTDAGRAAVRAWLDRDEDETDPDRSTFVLKLFFGAQADRAAVVRQLAAFRDAYATRLSVYEAKWNLPAPKRAAADPFTRMTLRYGILRARAAVEWADATLAELR